MGTTKVHYHQYQQSLDLTGKDLISLGGQPISAVEQIVGTFAPAESMTEIEVPVERVTSMTGEVAEQIHEWPNARMGSSFEKLSVHVSNGAMCNLVWGFSLSDFLPKKERTGFLGKLLSPRRWL
ncbi:MAG: hypothetical protein DHS20C11_06580 [Lysobacteraceae bacterium]|nr:MAG: hypothetical protein DHS20C11_06580 [Xanthomonadaceae bacterium]